MANHATFRPVTAFYLLEHTANRLSTLFLRKLVVGVLQLSHSDISLDVNSAVSWSLIALNRDIDLLVDNLALFVELSGLMGGRLSKVVLTTLEDIVAILLERRILVRLVLKL